MTRKENRLLKVKIFKLGPIEESEVELKPFTILFGKNNTGKTYVGYLLWGLASQKGYYHHLEPKTETYKKTLQEFVSKLQEKKIPQHYLKFYEDLPVDYFLGEYTLNGLRAKIKKDFISRIFNHPIEFEGGEIIIPKNIKFSISAIVKSDDEIHEYESLLVKQLKNRGYSVSFRQHRICIRIKLAKIKVVDKGKKDELAEKSKEVKQENERDVEKTDRVSVVVTKDRKEVYHVFLILNSEAYQDLVHNCNEIFEDIVRGLIKGLIKEAVYIPASKSGLVLLSGFIARRKLREEFRMDELQTEVEELKETLPEPLIDFIEKLPNFSPEKYYSDENRQFSKIVCFLEDNILKGKIKYIKHLGKIMYEFGNKKLPLQHSSSLVVEATPLLLYLKYSRLLDKGVLVIIEEPEAHLHPDAQRIIARALVRLVNRGLYVVLITHSPYMIQQINNCIRAQYLGKIGKLEKILEEFNWQKEDVLEHSKVVSYLFDDSNGTVKIRKLEVDEKDGIPYDAFYPVLKDLHNETERLKELFEGEETDDESRGN